MRIILDTHMWVWWLLAGSPLPDRQRKALDQIATERGLMLPAICMWEAQMLHHEKRIELPIPFSSWLRRATAPDMLTVLPLSADTVIAVDDLPASFHGDLADRMIVATARVHGLSLATHDDAIQKSKLVKIWRP